MKKRTPKIDPITLPDTDKDFPVGSATGFYRYSEFEDLAEGGVAKIQQCRDLNLNRLVAMKRLHGHLEGNKMEQRRFLREARVTAQIQHPNTVPVYEIGRDKMGQLYFTMKRVEGVDLRDIIAALTEQDPEAIAEYTLEILVEVFVQACHAIAFAHSRGVIHRDLKPANILIGPFNEVVLLDWGLAKVHGEKEVPEDLTGPALQVQRQTKQPLLELTQAGRRYGTPLYMSPEQARGDEDINERTDIYNLGIMLYEILTLKNVVWGTDLNQVLDDIQNTSPAPPREASPDRNIPPALEAICLRCLEKEPDKRYQHVTTLIDDVQAWQQEDDISVYEEPIPEKVWKWRERHFFSTTSLVAFIAGVLLTLLALAAQGAVPEAPLDPGTPLAPQRPRVPAPPAKHFGQQPPAGLPASNTPSPSPLRAVRKQSFPTVPRPSAPANAPLPKHLNETLETHAGPWLNQLEQRWRKAAPTLKELAELTLFSGRHAVTGGALATASDSQQPALTQRRAARLLWRHASPRQARAALTHVDAALRLWAVSILSARGLGSPADFHSLADKDPNPVVAAAAAEALADLRPAGEMAWGETAASPSSWWPTSGPGFARLPDSSRYEGQFAQGRFHGKGTLRWDNGDRYEGSFQRGLMHDQGTLTFGNGSRYTGEFANGNMSGKGTFVVSKFSTYVGEFKDGLYHGKGRVEYDNGSSYEGAFSFGEYHGQGKTDYGGGEYQAGSYENGLLEGDGVLVQSGLGQYEGGFKAGVMHGAGRLKFESGDVYRGAFIDGRMEGRGAMNFTDGSRFAGSFKGDMMHGKGILYLPGGETISGRWDEGEMADEYQLD